MESSNLNKSNPITEGPIIKSLISLATPVTLGMLLEVALNTTDYFWVGRLGSTAQDAVNTSMVVIWTVMSITSIVSVGITALVSRNVGAKDYDKAAYFVKQGLWLALLVGMVTSLAGLLFSRHLFEFMNASDGTIELGVPYMGIFFAATPFLFLMETSYASFRASGNTKTPAIVGASIVMVNLFLDPLLIFGIGPFPELGVTGAGVATGIAFFTGMTTCLILMKRGKLGYKAPSFIPSGLSFTQMRRIMKIGLPMSSHQLIFVIVYWFLIMIVHQFGVAAGAAMGIGNRMESVSYMICYGISLAASAMVGQNLGAGKPDRAASCAWHAIGLGMIVTFIVSVIFILFSEKIPQIFSDDAEAILIAKDYLIILALSQITMAIEIILEGSFSGAGDTVPPMIVMVPGNFLRIPLAYYLCFNLELGINGVWWTLTITTTIKAIILALWFKKGNWKHKQI